MNNKYSKVLIGVVASLCLLESFYNVYITGGSLTGDGAFQTALLFIIIYLLVSRLPEKE